MTTITIDIDSKENAQKLAETLRMVQGVTRVSIKNDAIQRIPGVPHTLEGLADVLQKVEDEHDLAKCIPHNEVARRTKERIASCK